MTAVFVPPLPVPVNTRAAETDLGAPLTTEALHSFAKAVCAGRLLHTGLTQKEAMETRVGSYLNVAQIGLLYLLSEP